MIITSESTAIFKLRQCLPHEVSSALSRLSKSLSDKISEIRLHAGGVCHVTIDGENLFLSSSGISRDSENAIPVSKNDLEDFLYRFCKGSIYTHEHSLSEFYITSDGIRVGIGGESTGGIIREVKSLNIRIPRHINGCSKELFEYIYNDGFKNGKGILIISKPGHGKTTMLRDLALRLSSYSKHEKDFLPKRVCVIDERNEIYMDNIFTKCCIDFLSGIPKVKGIEIASRVLSPEIIICDEISTSDEAEKITQQKNHGIVFIASFHSDSFANALSKEYINEMFKKGVFGAAYTLNLCGTKITGEISKYNDSY